MERPRERLSSADRALRTLEEILEMPFSIVVRDASIQRFEYTFESVWKLLQDYLRSFEGITRNSPKSCVREAVRLDLLSLDDAEDFIRMIDERNLTVHTYMEPIAQEVFQRLPGYARLMRILTDGIASRLGAPGTE